MTDLHHRFQTLVYPNNYLGICTNSPVLSVATVVLYSMLDLFLGHKFKVTFYRQTFYNFTDCSF